MGCKKCPYFKPYGKPALIRYLPFLFPTIFHKLRYLLGHVPGFCMDSENPIFNDYAKRSGRGMGLLEYLLRPKWCNRQTGDRHD
jgi:hypothetical protein